MSLKSNLQTLRDTEKHIRLMESALSKTDLSERERVNMIVSRNNAQRDHRTDLTRLGASLSNHKDWLKIHGLSIDKLNRELEQHRNQAMRRNAAAPARYHFEQYLFEVSTRRVDQCYTDLAREVLLNHRESLEQLIDSL